MRTTYTWTDFLSRRSFVCTLDGIRSVGGEDGECEALGAHRRELLRLAGEREEGMLKERDRLAEENRVAMIEIQILRGEREGLYARIAALEASILSAGEGR